MQIREILLEIIKIRKTAKIPESGISGSGESQQTGRIGAGYFEMVRVYPDGLGITFCQEIYV